MVGHLLWNMSRPTRRLASLIEAIEVLQKVSENKKWTRKDQTEFHSELAKSGIKTDGKTRKDSGGNRTWAGIMKIFGLWYEDESKKVILTEAAKVILENKGGPKAVEQIRHQILRFQWPNRTQEHESQTMDAGFKIFPYRFVIKLLLDNRIKYLLTNEIALFVLQTKTEKELEQVVKKILHYREMYLKDKIPLNKRMELVEEHKKLRPEELAKGNYSKERHFKYVTDLANTFMMHLSFFKEIKYEKNREHRQNEIRIYPDKEKTMSDIIVDYDKRFPLSALSYLVKNEDPTWFAKSYGSKYYNEKTSKKTSKPKTRNEKDLELLTKIITKILEENSSISKEKLVNKTSERTGMSEERIKKILVQNPDIFSFNNSENTDFARKYLEVASDGKKYEEFEEMTREIFRSFGFPVDKTTLRLKTGNELELDGFVRNDTRSGIIDAKSGKKFSCGNKEVGIMKDYIDNFRIHVHDDIKYNLEFFAYVYGKKFDNKGNFERIIHESKVQGAIISANELLNIKKKFDQKKISKENIWALCKSGKEITSFDY